MSGFGTRLLGKTGLPVSPLGIGGGPGISSEDLLYAFDRGVNYFFYSSDLHHFRYRTMAEALRKLCGSGSRVRDQVVLATVSYVNDPEKLESVLMDQFEELGIDYVDVFHWGRITDASDCQALFESAGRLKQEGDPAEYFRASLASCGLVAHLGEDLRRRGLARYVGAAFHSRRAARQWMKELDVLMLRYNLVHWGVEREVFPGLTGVEEQDPGIVVFNVARHPAGLYQMVPPGYPPDWPVPTPGDCYRWALSNPAVDVVLTGVKDRHELDQALAAVEQGPFGADECAFLRHYGQLVAAAVAGRGGASPESPDPHRQDPSSR